MYGFGALGGDWGGMLCDLVRVPYADAMLVPLPDGLAPEAVASASDNLPDAYRTVAPHLAARPGADVLVLGGGARSIGLYAAGLAVALGAGRVVFADTDPHRLAVASDLGAEPLALAGDEPRVAPGFPIVVDAGASGPSLTRACRSTEAGGCCTHVGVVYEAATPLPVLEMYTTGMSLHVGRAMARAAIEPVLALVARERLRPELVTDRVVPWGEAAAALLAPHVKLVFARPG